jgi:excinuclease ABC subunit C
MFKDKLSLVPHLPGSYQMRNSDGVIIYVGKAKDLHRRLSSYFNRTQTGKTAKMVSEIADFTYIVANSELEAFIIEINLIKEFDPKYNILLKDDKSYPYIEYISKPYPRVKVSRYLSVKKKDNKKLFGPYPNAYAARRIVNLLNRIYPLKKCEGKQKELCLYYHIHECLGYCSKELDKSKLAAMESEILSFLNGNDKILTDRLEAKMAEYSEALNFEMALEMKKELEYIKIIMDKQKVELHDFVNRDIIGFYFDKGYISIQIFFLRNGKLVGGKSDIFPLISEVKDDLEYYIAKFYTKHEVPKEILIPSEIDSDVLKNVIASSFVIPSKGAKKKLLDMAIMNSKLNLERELELVKKEEYFSENANDELRKLLGLKSLYRIDLFDNSNLFGSFSVSGMVVFKDGRPSKSDYRKFKVSVDKNDDYNTMREVIRRRYSKMLSEHAEAPDLIIADGGEKQVAVVKDTLNDLGLNIMVCGLKKNDHHRTNDLVLENLEVVEIDRTSNLFHYLTRMQDEVHNYTINYHRTIRSKGSISSVLDNIYGIGAKRKKELIKKYGSVNKMKEASVADLETILPSDVAKNLYEFLKDFK